MADLGIARLNNEADASGTLTRADLADVVHRKLGLSRAESASVVERVLHHMCHSLAEGANVKISGFGTFILRDKGQRIGRNPEDRDRSADRAAAGDDLPRQPDHARPDRQGLSRRVATGDKEPGALQDDRRTVAGAGRRPAHPALLGNALPAAAADAARRQPPLLPPGRRRPRAAHPPPAQPGRLYRPRRPEAASRQGAQASDGARAVRRCAVRCGRGLSDGRRRLPPDHLRDRLAAALENESSSRSRGGDAERKLGWWRGALVSRAAAPLLRSEADSRASRSSTRAIASSSGKRRTGTPGGKADSSRDGIAADRITNMPAIALAADQPAERLRQPGAHDAVVISAPAAGHPPRRVEHGRPRPRHALHHHQPQRFAGHVDPVAQAHRCRAARRADRRGRCRPESRRRSDRHAGRAAAGRRAPAGRRSAHGPPSAAGSR